MGVIFVLITAVIVIWIALELTEGKKLKLKTNYGLIIRLLCLIIVYVGIIIATVIPLSSTEVEKVSVNLTNLRDSELVPIEQDNLFYILITGKNSYTYCMEENSVASYTLKKKYTNYKNMVITDEYVRIIEEDNCIEPRLVMYVTKAKNAFWSLRSTKDVEYVFYVPKGSVFKNTYIE